MTDSERLRNRVIAFISILNLVVPAGLRAADATQETTTASNPAPPKHHYKHKKKASVSATSNATAAPAADIGSNRRTAAENTDAPGMSDSLGSNNPGGPNMGSPDHTPGTSGTSGQ